MYDTWRADPAAVDESWNAFFQGFELALGSDRLESESRDQSRVDSLMYAYRSIGHLIATIDPLGERSRSLAALELDSFELGEADLDRTFDTGHLAGAPDRLTLREIIDTMREIYCGNVGVEYIHIQDRAVRRWLQGEMERSRNRPEFDTARKREVLEGLVEAELSESFTHARYPGQKRFSLEGGESLIPALQATVERCGDHGIREVVLGMAHRGRLNVLTNVVGLSYEMIFTEFEGNFLADSVQGDGDVKYHKGYSSTWKTSAGADVHISLTANPSHLEAVYPVVQGRVRAKQRQHQDVDRRSIVLPLVIHGDAAFAGQGVVAETLQLSQLKGYQTGGTLHFIVNNQIGFTTSPTEGRSSPYPTDVAKMIEAPIFHVNGDDPEAVVWVTELALRFRQKFGRDVVVDMVCYRRHGHNEGDEPGFTQPLMVANIKRHSSVRKLYASKLVGEGTLSQEEENAVEKRFKDVLSDAYDEVKRRNPHIEVQAFRQLWAGMDGEFSFDPVDTAVSRDLLVEVARALSTVPEGFHLHRKLARQLPERLEAVKGGGMVDWGTAEQLAFGTLLAEGTPIRLSGQDSARGTFSHRHAIWYDTQTAEPHIPLLHIRPEQARFCVYNSSLSEAAVLGFEYGYAVTEPHMLLLWEAQFGDFVNGAQVIIDQFVMGAESKWQRDSGLVMLLPHGYEGQGPEHSNAYLERFLVGCAEKNVQVVNATTPAQYFHLLRRQVRRDIRLPLVVMTPKSLLRHSECVSPISDLTDGGFEEMLADPTPPEGEVRRLLLCSGKIFYDLIAARRERGIRDVAIVRVEQFHPFHEEKLLRVVEPYRSAKEVVWVQEESQNRGGWSYMLPLLFRIFCAHDVAYAGRDPSASPATGSLKRHREEQERVVETALTGSLRDSPPGTVAELVARGGRCE